MKKPTMQILRFFVSGEIVVGLGIEGKGYTAEHERTALGGLVPQTKELKEREGTVWKGVSEEFMSELQRIVILPGKEREIELLAPDYVNIPAKTSFTINFLDVPTKVDAASNPTEKQGWTWIVNYDRKMSKKPVEVTVENKRLTVAESYELNSRGSVR